MRGWFNYFEIPGVGYQAMNKLRLRHYQFGKLNRYYNHKSQMKCWLY